MPTTARRTTSKILRETATTATATPPTIAPINAPTAQQAQQSIAPTVMLVHLSKQTATALAPTTALL